MMPYFSFHSRRKSPSTSARDRRSPVVDCRCGGLLFLGGGFSQIVERQAPCAALGRVVDVLGRQ